MSRGPAPLGAHFPGSHRRPTAGNRAHFRYGVPMCEPCRAAERQRRGQRKRRAAECGTRGGYARHLYLGEETCQPCRDAHAAYVRSYMKGYRQQQRARVEEEVARARRGY